MHAVWSPAAQAFIRYLEIPGDDPPLVWLHGWQCSSTGELLPAAVAAPLRGRRSLLIDFLGHGYSDKPTDFAYTVEAHAATIVALLDHVGVTQCVLIGHSMGGGIAVHVAAARPQVVRHLVMAEGLLDPDEGPAFDGQTESEFVDHGFAELLDSQWNEAIAEPTGLRAVHIGITRLIEPRAIYREDVSMRERTTPSIRSLLAAMPIPRWHLIGAWSDPEDLEPGLAAIGVRWAVVPDAGHPMGLQNPYGFAQAVASAIDSPTPR